MVGINSRQTLASTSKIPRSNGLGFIPFDLMVFIRSSSSSVHCRPSFIRLHLRSLPTARLHPLTFISRSMPSYVVIRSFFTIPWCHSPIRCCFLLSFVYFTAFLCPSSVFCVLRLESIHANWFRNTKSNWEGSTYTSVVTSSRYPPTDYSCFYH